MDDDDRLSDDNGEYYVYFTTMGCYREEKREEIWRSRLANTPKR